jgi:WD40 repeat protein
MGVVYRARQQRLQRLVALKMIRSGAHAEEQEFTRFQVEAQAVARLQHPHIVQIFEVGEQDECPFLALELVEGGSLAQKLAGAPLPADQAARLVETLARTMHAAHERGIVHRDLKPANILLSADGQPKITDFGLAKRLDGETAYTPSGAVLGTPSYMAPEQAAGRTAQIGPGSDVYALGAILYELVTGRPPFKAATTLETLGQVLTEEPVPPSRLQPKLPRDLETICLKCLEKPREKRYASALDLAEDLNRYQAREPIEARPIRSWERAAKWVRRRPAVTALLVLLALVPLALTGLGLYALKQAADSDAARRQAEHTGERLREELYVADVDAACSAWDKGNIEAVLDLLSQHLPVPGQPDERRFEWYYLWRCAEQSHMTLKGHHDMVRAVAFAPSGDLVASASWDNTVRLWDVHTHQTRQLLDDFKGRVTALAFSPDGNMLACAAWAKDWMHGSGELRLRELSTGTERRPPLPTGGTLGMGGVTTMAFAPDGKTLALGMGQFQTLKDTTGRIEFLDPATGKRKGRAWPLQGHLVLSLAYSPDGKRLAAGTWKKESSGSSGSVRLWETATGKEQSVPQGHHGGVSSVAFSPDGTTLASGSWDETVLLWDVRKQQVTARLTGHSDRVLCVAFAPDGKTLAASSADGVVRLWQLPQGKALLDLRGHTLSVYSLAFCPDGKWLATGSWDRTIKLWDLERERAQAIPPAGHTDWVYCVAFAPDGKTLASGGVDKSILLWDVATGKVRQRLTGHTGDISALAFAPNSRTLASSSWDQSIRVWDLERGRSTVVGRHQGRARAVAFSPDGQTLASGGEDRQVRLWDWKTPAPLREFQVSAIVNCVAFAPNRPVLAAGTGDRYSLSAGQIILWNLTRPEEPTSIATGGAVPALAFEPDGQALAAWTAWFVTHDHIPGALRLWNVDTRQVQTVLQEHMGSVSSIAFSPDGRTVAAGSGEEAIRLWDLQAGRERAILRGHTDRVITVAFAPDGRTLASGGLDQIVRFWRGASERDVVRHYEELARDNPEDQAARLSLIRALWGQYLHRSAEWHETGKWIEQGLDEGLRLLNESLLPATLNDEDHQQWIATFRKARTGP